MPRIRSIHPGIFTDEAFMSASPMARILLFGIWTEAWDDGVFEWKPIVLKARIFPADGCDISALLDELCSLNVLKKVERGGKLYGMIRNFRKFQRPKKPNKSGIATELDAEFLGPEYQSSEPVRNQFGTSSEISPQMEDGGGRKEEKKEDTSLRSVSDIGASDCKAPKRENPATAFVGILSGETAKAVVAHRKAKKSPLTMRAAELLAKEFAATGRPEDAANAMIAHGWQGFKAEWLTREARAGPAVAQPARRGSAALFDAMDRIYPDAPDRQAIPSSAVLQLADHRQR